MKNICPLISYLLILFITISCNKPKELNEVQQKNFYSLLNNFILDSLFPCDYIGYETTKILTEEQYKSKSNEYKMPTLTICFNDWELDSLVIKKIISIYDLKNIHRQIADTSIFYIDESSIKRVVCHRFHRFS